MCTTESTLFCKWSHRVIVRGMLSVLWFSTSIFSWSYLFSISTFTAHFMLVCCVLNCSVILFDRFKEPERPQSTYHNIPARSILRMEICTFFLLGRQWQLFAEVVHGDRATRNQERGELREGITGKSSGGSLKC